MSLLPSADVFRSIELKVPQLLGRQLVCPHVPGERCSVGEHLTLSEAEEAAARDAADAAVRDALWRCVGCDARSDVPNLAQRGQLLALYGLALAAEADDVRDQVLRAANAAGWAVERADPAERTTDPRSLVDRASLLGDDYSPIRNDSDIQVVGEVDSLLGERISGERMGATLHRLGLLGAFLASGPGQMPEGESDELDGLRKEAE
ncbi:hypothetical protein [Streptomyces sp. NPDC047061]|uniref:hypothetical protein n=1 Tax=Streptomyces sp. NPDC047061 TaxID=3154605 RepID=UPI0033D7BE78